MFTLEQVQKLLAVANEDWRGIILFGWYTGARVGDIANLRWNQVDLEQQIVTLTQRKTGEMLKLPLHPELLAWLRNPPVPVAAANGNSAIFTSVNSRQTSNLSNQFAAIMRRAGIERQKIRQGNNLAGRSLSALTFHSLRHSFDSHLANAGVSQEIRQMLTGHASKAVNSKYTHLQLGILKEAVSLLPNLHP